MTATGVKPVESLIDYPPVRRGSDWILISLIAVVITATLVAMVKPAWALRIALICAVAAACGAAAWWLIAMVSRTEPERRTIDTTRDTASGPPGNPPRRPAPLAVSELRHAHGMAGLSAQGLRYLQFVATERLWANHRLNLAHTPHHHLIQSMVTPELWHLLRGQPSPYYTHLPLPLLLQEIERL